MSARKIALIALVLILGIVGFSSIFTVRETDQALVLEFGKFVRTESKPGLHFKTPFIQTVKLYDKRVLDYDIEASNASLRVESSDRRRGKVASLNRQLPVFGQQAQLR